jgi:hypothetical protein
MRELPPFGSLAPGLRVRATSVQQGTPVVMRADRPFDWAVVHEPSGRPIFAGQVGNPAA